MSTEVARFENEKDGRSLFLRYCGTPEEQTESGSVSRARLQVSLPHNRMSFTTEQAVELGRELVSLFPVKRMRPFLYENERELTLVYAEDEALAWQQVADDKEWEEGEEGEDNGTMRPLPVSEVPASFILSI